MKKLLSILLILVMLVLPMLSACGSGGEPEEPQEEQLGTMEKINMAMDRVSSYEAYAEIDILAYVADCEVELSGTSDQIYANDDDGLYYYSEIDISTKYNGTYVENYIMEAYNDGNYFYAYGEGNRKKKFYSELAGEEFEEYMNQMGSDFALLEGYGELSDVVDEAGFHTVTLSKYNEDAVRQFNIDYGFPMESGGAVITDLEVTINATPGYLVNEITVNYIFSHSKFVGTETVSYYNYNSAVKNLNDVKPSAYKKVDDAKIIPLLNSLLKDKSDSEEGYFVFDNEVTMTMGNFASGGTAQHYEVSYGVDDSGYYFDMNAVSEGADSQRVTYKDGVYKMDGDEVKDSGFDDVVAKEFIDELIDAFSYNERGVKDVEIKSREDDKVTYKIALNVNDTVIPSNISTIYSGIGGRYSSSSAYMEVVMEKGELMSVEYYVESSGYIYLENKRYAMEVDMVVKTDFDASADTTTQI